MRVSITGWTMPLSWIKGGNDIHEFIYFQRLHQMLFVNVPPSAQTACMACFLQKPSIQIHLSWQDVRLRKQWIWMCFDALLPLLPQKVVFFHNHICTFINTDIHRVIRCMYLTQSAPSIIHSAINTGQHTVLFNHSQTMNLWGKELQVFHLCEVAMATPQQTLYRTRVFPINAFFPSKMSVRAHCVANGLGGAASESEKRHFRHYSYSHAWYKQGAKSLCRHLEVTRRTGRLRLSSDEDCLTNFISSHWTFACLPYMFLLTTPHCGNRGRQIKLNFYWKPVHYGEPRV